MIGIISRTEGEGSGAEIILCHLLNNWHNSYPLVVITAQGSSVSRVAKANGIQTIELAFVPERILPNVKQIENCLKHLKGLQLVHAWNSKSFELGWYVAKRLGIKLTCTMHDHPRASYFTPRKLWLLKAIANSSAGLVAVSHVLAKECKTHGYRCPITTIHNGLPSGKSRKQESSTDKLRIGFLGMSSEVKGFPIIADWIRNTSSSQEVTWSLYGDVCSKNEQIITKLQTEGINNFSVNGRRKPDEIFNQIDILVHASTVFDCYPTVLLEAARAGIAAVASTKGGAGEIIKHEHSGVLFDPSQPAEGLHFLSRLCKEPELYRRYSNNALHFFEQNLGVSQMVKKYNEFWQQKLSERNSSVKTP